MKLISNHNWTGSDDQTFSWEKDGVIVASITLYPNGLVEFSGDMEVGIENVGKEHKEQVTVGQLEIHNPRPPKG